MALAANLSIEILLRKEEFNMNKITNVMTLALAFCTIAGASNAALVHALDTSPGTYGTEPWSGTLGLDFNVNAGGSQQIIITQLGIFDDGQNGLNHPATVTIYNRSNGAPIVSSFFGGGIGTIAPGTGSRYNGILQTILTPGQYSIVADYNTDLSDVSPNSQHTGAILNGDPTADKNYNTAGAPNNNVVVNTNGGAISFVGTARASGHNVYPIFPDTGPSVRYNAGTFTYDVVPEPSSIAMLAGLAVTGAGFAFRLRRRSKK